MSHYQIRPAGADDLAACLQLDDSYTTNIVWQVVENRAAMRGPLADEGEQHAVAFRPTRLPRPRLIPGLAKTAPQQIRANWQHTDFFSIATSGASVVGYINLYIEKRRNIVWLTALTVAETERRNGIATALLNEAKEWARLTALQCLMAELSTTNYPAAHFLHTQGFRFCGYNDALDAAGIETLLFFTYPLA